MPTLGYPTLLDSYAMAGSPPNLTDVNQTGVNLTDVYFVVRERRSSL